jgi:UrcA family protein
MTRFKIASFCLALSASFTALAVTSVRAAPVNVELIRISTAGLDLSTSEGKRDLHRRARIQAEQLCTQGEMAPALAPMVRACVDQTRTAADRAIAQALLDRGIR